MLVLEGVLVVEAGIDLELGLNLFIFLSLKLSVRRWTKQRVASCKLASERASKTLSASSESIDLARLTVITNKLTVKVVRLRREKLSRERCFP